MVDHACTCFRGLSLSTEPALVLKHSDADGMLLAFGCHKWVCCKHVRWCQDAVLVSADDSLHSLHYNNLPHGLASTYRHVCSLERPTSTDCFTCLCDNMYFASDKHERQELKPFECSRLLGLRALKHAFRTIWAINSTGPASCRDESIRVNKQLGNPDIPEVNFRRRQGRCHGPP